ncbi:hypothetical protein ACOJCM_04725 [Billgrantia sp. LNSP4103-1]|uniref:hypothetical protein n=1 Tax=Billgrantia sp. LNSP4103-1 TaxID=3410266 RepID=UPI00403F34FA
MPRLLVLKTGGSFPDVIAARGDFEDGFRHRLARYGDRQWGVSFHPEFGTRLMLRYVTRQAARLRRLGQNSETLHEGVRDTPETSGLLEAFADLVVKEA